MRAWAALRALLPIELRAARRQPTRTALILALVAIPVAAMVAGGALFQTSRPTPEELRSREMGAATLRVQTYDALPKEQLPAALATAQRLEGYSKANVDSPAEQAVLWSMQPTALEPGGLAHGMLRLAAGRAPSAAQDIALSLPWAESLGIPFGAKCRIAGVERVLCGVVVDPEHIDAWIAWSKPQASEAHDHWLADVEQAQAPQIAQQLFELGHHAQLRSQTGVQDEFEPFVTFVVGGFAFFEAALVIAAAFAVGWRRRQREIGLVRANGASGADVLRSLLCSTLALVGLACLAGVMTGLALAYVLHPTLDGWNQRLNGPLEFSISHMLGGVGMGFAAAFCAVLLPAIKVARLDVRAALSGRRPNKGASKLGFALGVVCLAIAIAWMAVALSSDASTAASGILGASICVVLGLGILSPWLLVQLARAAAPLPMEWRLAARDTARFHSRNGPVVTAILAALSICILLATLASSVDARIAQHANAQEVMADRGLVQLALVLCCGTAVLVVLIATALSTEESRPDARTLHAIGAAPRTQRRVIAVRAAYLAAIGALLAVPAGLTPSWGLIQFADAQIPFTIPWLEVALIVLALPFLSSLAAWLQTFVAGPDLVLRRQELR